MQQCHRCGAANSLNATNCHACGAILDEQEAAVDASFRPVTSRFDEFASQVEDYCGGKIDRQEFGRWLLQTRDHMQYSREDYVAVIKDAELEDVDVSGVRTEEQFAQLQVQKTEYFTEREEEVTLAMEGIMEMEEAVNMMLEFAFHDDMDEAILVTALQKMWDGNLKCNEAIRLNRVYREKLFSGN